MNMLSKLQYLKIKYILGCIYKLKTRSLELASRGCDRLRLVLAARTDRGWPLTPGAGSPRCMVLEARARRGLEADRSRLPGLSATSWCCPYETTWGCSVATPPGGWSALVPLWLAMAWPPAPPGCVAARSRVREEEEG
jgi:hypothetical protein